MKNKKYLLFILIIITLILNNLNAEENQQIKSIYDLQARFHEIAKKNMSSVVLVSTEKTITQNYNFFDPFDFFFDDPWSKRKDDGQKKKKQFKQGGLGSGVIYKKNGDKYYIITNNHVIEGVDSIKIVVSEDKSYIGKILGTDPDIDISVIEIKTKDQLNSVNVGDSDKIEIGDFVIAIGNPFGLQGTMTFGIISAIGRSDLSAGRASLTNFIQTDAAINPGNSGGPLINLDGEVIGINTLIYSRDGGNVGIGFAIPVNIAKTIADQIIDKGKVEHGYLGINFEELTEEKIKTLNFDKIKSGMHVLSVLEGSAAEKAGIKTGDVILELNGKELKKSSDLTIAIGNSKPGTKVIMKILRDGNISEKEIILGNRNEMKVDREVDSQILENYGLKLADLTKTLKEKYKIPSGITGVIITDIDPNGTASQAGLNEGDVIYKINNKKINSVEEFKNVLKENEDGNYFFVLRNGKEFIIRM